MDRLQLWSNPSQIKSSWIVDCDENFMRTLTLVLVIFFLGSLSSPMMTSKPVCVSIEGRL